MWDIKMETFLRAHDVLVYIGIEFPEPKYVESEQDLTNA